jgi:hypothetical protein
MATLTILTTLTTLRYTDYTDDTNCAYCTYVKRANGPTTSGCVTDATVSIM